MFKQVTVLLTTLYRSTTRRKIPSVLDSGSSTSPLSQPPTTAPGTSNTTSSLDGANASTSGSSSTSVLSELPLLPQTELELASLTLLAQAAVSTATSGSSAGAGANANGTPSQPSGISTLHNSGSHNTVASASITRAETTSTATGNGDSVAADSSSGSRQVSSRSAATEGTTTASDEAQQCCDKNSTTSAAPVASSSSLAQVHSSNASNQAALALDAALAAMVIPALTAVPSSKPSRIYKPSKAVTLK